MMKTKALPTTCPKCQSRRVVAGNHFNWIAGGSAQYFQPKELRLFSSSSHIRIRKSGFFACVDCGLLWSEVDAKKLQSLLSESGDLKLKARLDYERIVAEPSRIDHTHVY